MNKRLPLFIGGVLVLLVIAAWDRSRATETTLRATLADVEERQTNAGPDQWFITVTFGDQSETLGPLQARPTEVTGDTICIIQSIATHRDPTYRRAPAATRC